MDGKQLAQAIRTKAEEFRKVCAAIDDKTASRAPEGRWSPKEIVSHLIGAEGGGMAPVFKMFLEQETPELDLHPADPCFTESRSRTPFGQLLDTFSRDHEAAAAFVEGLSPAQLGRKAHVPALKESPLGEYPTLEVFIQGIVDHHLTFHIDHMREILQGLGAAGKP